MLIYLFIFLFITILMLLLSIFISIILFYTKVPFVRTPSHITEMILDNIYISKTDIVYDLGCGDASTLIAVEKKFGATTIGYEISPWAYFIGRLNIKFSKSKTKILYKNFYKEDLSDANIVFCYLIDSVMEKVGHQLKKQLKPGSTIVSFGFHIPGWEPVKTIKTQPDNPKASKIFIYKI